MTVQQFRNILFVIHYMEFDEFCKIFGYPHQDPEHPRYAYAMDKFKLMQKSVLSFTGHLDSNNLEIFWNYITEQVKQRYEKEKS